MSEFTLTFVPQELNLSFTAPSFGLSTGTPMVREYVERPAYEGAYEVTPSAETQTLLTNSFRMTDNVVINPIPNNYGLITWDGSTITVS